MTVFEKEIKELLTARAIPFQDRTRSNADLDFYLPEHNMYLDAKEKAQRFSMKNWSEASMPQESLFIIDDLAARKILFHAPHSFCLIKDSSAVPPMYYIYSVIDLFCVPKTRVKRPIERSVKAYKGKWLLDLRDAAAFESLDDAFEYLFSYRKKFDRIFSTHIDCWGRYPSENVKTSGQIRTAGYWKKDSQAHS